jgi:hypothetical protein
MTIEVVDFEEAFSILCDAVRETERQPEYAEAIIDKYGEILHQVTIPIVRPPYGTERYK